MRRSLPANLTLLAGCIQALLLACSNTSSVDDGSMADATIADAADAELGDARATDVTAGDAGPRLGFTVAAVAQCRGNEPIAGCAVTAIVIVGMVPGPEVVNDATVSMNGEALRPAGAGGLYQGVLVGHYAASFDATVTRAAETIADSTHAASDFTATLSPSAPSRDMPLTVTWTPSAETGVEMDITVTGPAGSGAFGMPFQDNGTATIPATVFSVSGAYSIHLYRRFFTRGTVGILPSASPRNAGIDRTFMVTVP